MRFSYTLVVMIILAMGACAPENGDFNPEASPSQPIKLPTVVNSTEGDGNNDPVPDQDEGGVLSWDDAVVVILEGKVNQVIQFHDLTVVLVLEDGLMVEAIQPEIDEVLRVIDRCGTKCADIQIATE